MPADRRTTQAVAETAARGPGTTDPLLGELRRSGLLPVLVLHFIAEAPSYGNQLMERIEPLSGGALAVNPNTMYPLLRSLEAKALVRGEWEHPERRSRRFYRITPAGRDELERLSAELGPRLDAIARRRGAHPPRGAGLVGKVKASVVLPGFRALRGRGALVRHQPLAHVRGRLRAHRQHRGRLAGGVGASSCGSPRRRAAAA